MIKFVKVFSIFIVLHLAGWIATHIYLKHYPSEVLVIVDTSYAMKPKFNAMLQWIENFESEAHYQTLLIGTDKTMLGKLVDLKLRNIIFKTAFGKLTQNHLQRYSNSLVKKKILLSDGSVKPDGWKIVEF